MRARIQVTQYRENYQTENLLRNALYSAIVGSEASHLYPHLSTSSLSLSIYIFFFCGDWSIEGTMNACSPACIQKQEGLRDNGATLWELRVTQANENGESYSFILTIFRIKQCGQWERKKTFRNYHLKFSLSRLESFSRLEKFSFSFQCKDILFSHHVLWAILSFQEFPWFNLLRGSLSMEMKMKA